MGALLSFFGTGLQVWAANTGKKQCVASKNYFIVQKETRALKCMSRGVKSFQIGFPDGNNIAGTDRLKVERGPILRREKITRVGLLGE